MFNSRLGARPPRAVVPACVTLASMFCGYLSVTSTLKGNFTAAAWLIVCSGILDALDGPVARLLGAATKFGGELDSFADLVSFGLAPSLLFYRAYFVPWGTAGLILSFLPTMIGAVRLTRYNITTSATVRDYSSGFTTTASASLLASFLLFSTDLWSHHVLPGVAAALVLLTSALMVSRVRYITVTRFVASGLWRKPKGVLCLLIAACVLLFPTKVFFPAMVALMLEGLLGHRVEQVLHHLEGVRRQHRGI